MNSSIVSTLVGGGFALLGVTIGSLFTNRLTIRTLMEQRAYAESLRVNELAREEHKEFHPLSKEERATIGRMIDKGGRSVDLNRIAETIRSNQRISRITEETFYCFPKGTMVMLNDETFHPIEQLHEGDLIKIYRTYSHIQSESAVSAIVVGPGNQLIEINGSLAVTPEQEILTDHGYVPAMRLQLDMKLVSDTHRAVDIKSLELNDIDENVYSEGYSGGCVEVEGDHG
jgi:hypothetical protein